VTIYFTDEDINDEMYMQTKRPDAPSRFTFLLYRFFNYKISAVDKF